MVSRLSWSTAVLRLAQPCVVAATLAAPRAAAAQVHWDIGVGLGAMQRVTTANSTPHVPTPGPAAEAHAHVAVLPMLRAGPYLSYDVSPASGTSARQMAEAGLRAKVTPPLFAAPWHGWVFLGCGYTYTRTQQVDGGILDVPLGVGLGRRLRGAWEVFGELGGRFGLAFGGRMYDEKSASYIGRDSLAVSLSVGVSLEE